MSKDDIVYDEQYYHYYYDAVNGSSNYDRENIALLNFFKEVARKIVQDINPKTVLDIGCAKGFLVEALRDLGVEAYGIDISEYAISEVREDIKPYCKVSSADEILTQHYDLIVSIEVLEHIESKLIPSIIHNICSHTDRVIFSSTPIDFKEPTHINIQPTEYWVEKFYECGFTRMVDYDASYIAEPTIFFTRSYKPIGLILKEYERNFYRLYNEKTQLRQELAQLSQEVNQSRELMQQLQITHKEYESINKEYERINKEYEKLHKEDSNKLLLAEEKIRSIQALDDELKYHNNELRENNEELRQSNVKFREINAELKESNIQFREINAQLKESNANLQQLSSDRMLIINDIKNTLCIMQNTKGWRLLNHLRRIRNAMMSLPKNIKKGIKLVGKFIINCKVYGWRVTLSKTRRYIRNKGQVAIVQPESVEDEKLRREYLVKCKKEVNTFKEKPLISFIVPVFNTPIDVLKEMIECVRNQIYENWELCLVNASPDNKEVCRALQEYVNKDSRIREIALEENKGISGNSNEGLKQATGEFIALLDHDDIIVEEALFEVVKKLQEDTSYDFFYSDKDMMSADGTKFYNPLYKPEWSLEMLYSANYITHFDVIRKSLMLEVGGFDSTTDGAQDWDMFLKVGEVARKVCHIPKILYHWRMIETSAASGIEAKPYALDAQIRSINNHLIRVGINAEARFIDRKLYVIKVEYELPKCYTISIIIKDTVSKTELQRLIKEIKGSALNDIQYELIIATSSVHHDLDADLLWYELKQDEDISTNRELISMCQGQTIVFLSTDITIQENTLYELIQWTINPNVGFVGPKFIRKDGKIDHVGIRVEAGKMKPMYNQYENPTYDVTGYTEWYRNSDIISDKCSAISKKCLEQLLALNEREAIQTHFELCLKVKELHKRNVYVPFANAYINRSTVEHYIENRGVIYG